MQAKAGIGLGLGLAFSFSFYLLSREYSSLYRRKEILLTYFSWGGLSIFLLIMVGDESISAVF